MTRVLRLILFAAAALAAGCIRHAPPAPAPSPTPVVAQLPHGGRTIFPRLRVVAYYGAPGVPAMGVLGQGTPDQAARRLVAQANAYASKGRPVQPAFELIATLAEHDAGAYGYYSVRADDADIRRYVDAARKVHALTILDIQPGRRSFVTEMRHYRTWLAMPDVELALDPEWKMDRGQTPGETIGHTTAAAINAVSSELAALVAAKHLPQKLLVIHQFVPEMIANERTIVPRPGLAIVFHADGFGPRDGKVSKYHLFAHDRPFFNGFKLFYTQDTHLFAPGDVMRLLPVPDLITYE